MGTKIEKKLLLIVLSLFMVLDALPLLAKEVPQSIEITINELAPYYTKVIHTYGPWRPQDVEIRNLRSYPSKIKVPKGAKVTFQPTPPANGRYLGRVTVPITVIVDGNAFHRVQVSGQVEVYKEVICVKRSLKKGEVLKRDDLIVTRRPLSRLHGEPVTDVESALGMELRRSLRGGQILRERDLRRPIVVKRGQIVEIIARTSNVLITLKGRAQDSGAKGDVIRVRNATSKKVLLAQVVGPKTVEVTF